MDRAATGQGARCYAVLGEGVGARGRGRPAAPGSRRRRKGVRSARRRIERAFVPPAVGGKTRRKTTRTRRRAAAVRVANASMTAGLLVTLVAAPMPPMNGAKSRTTSGTGPA